MSSVPNKLKVAVLGAGPSGLSILRSFALAEADGKNIPEILCFERQSDWGGMWNYTWRTGLDEFGEPCHNGMYRHLWSNAPKECYEYPDYTFDKHFGRAMPSYLAREPFRDYIAGRAKESNIRRYISFNTAVRYVEFDDQKKQFHVRVQDLTTGETFSHAAEYVIVATSHFSVPSIPHFEGFEKFNGRIIHSHDFRDAEQFAGQNILVVGGSYSAEDIALQSYKFGAKSVTISYRSKPMGFKWPKAIEEVPVLTHVEGKSAHFLDGTKREVDSIILCTGYQHHFPFIADKLRLVTRNRLYPGQLYKGIFFQDQPRLIYIGMQDLNFSTTLFDCQAWYARDVILGRIQIPGADERAADIAIWQEREARLKDHLEEIDFQADYMGDLLAVTDYPKVQLRAVAAMLKQWEHDKDEDILTYRDKSYTSSITGTTGVASALSWIDAKNEENLVHPTD